MTRVAALAVLLLASSAAAAPGRKATPDKFGRAAGEAFRRAMELEDKGDLKQASGLYEQSLDLFAHPNTAFNLAAVYERGGELENAILSYELYLLLAPDAPDAAAVRAKISELEKRPAILTVKLREGIDPKDCYVILDGTIIKKPGELARHGNAAVTFDVTLPRGKHALELYTILGTDYEQVAAKPGEKLSKELVDGGTSAGNLAVTADYPFDVNSHTDGHGRTTEKPGKQLIPAAFADLECRPILVDVPSNDDVAYIYIRPLEPDLSIGSNARRCRKHEVIQQRLVFK